MSSFGDIILTTPVLRCLRQQKPEAEIHFLIKKKYAAILENNPYVDKFIYYENNLSECISELKAENYEIIIDLHKNIRSFIIRSKLQIKAYSFPKLNLLKLLLVKLKINFLPHEHLIDRYFKAVRKLNVFNDHEGCDYLILPDENLKAIDISSQYGIQKFYVFAIGGTYFTKRMPAEKFTLIADKLNLPVVLLGGSNDRNNADIIASNSINRIINLCGQLSIRMSAAVLNLAEAVLTHDTGLMHIAAALDKKVISVWGNTVPDFGMTPYFANKSEKVNQSEIIEVKGLKCRPCSKLGKSKCPKGHFNCMQLIDEEVVVNSLMRKTNDNK